MGNAWRGNDRVCVYDVTSRLARARARNIIEFVEFVEFEPDRTHGHRCRRTQR